MAETMTVKHLKQFLGAFPEDAKIKVGGVDVGDAIGTQLVHGDDGPSVYIFPRAEADEVIRTRARLDQAAERIAECAPVFARFKRALVDAGFSEPEAMYLTAEYLKVVNL